MLSIPDHQPLSSALSPSPSLRLPAVSALPWTSATIPSAQRGAVLGRRQGLEALPARNVWGVGGSLWIGSAVLLSGHARKRDRKK